MPIDAVQHGEAEVVGLTLSHKLHLVTLELRLALSVKDGRADEIDQLEAHLQAIAANARVEWDHDQSINAAGTKEKMYEAYTQGDKDFNSLVSKMKANKIDVVYVGGYHTEAGLILRQMRGQGMATQMISGDAIATNEFWSITGAAGEGMMFTFGSDPRKRPTASLCLFAAKFP